MTKYNAINAFLKNKDGEWISPYTADTLKKNQIANCLLEVPQNIKLELNNGTITLKAGSVVTVPNGFEADGTTRKFDYITIESDISYTYLGDSLTAKLFWNAKTNKVYGEYRTYSGTTESPTESYVTKYDVTLNKVFRSTDGITWSDEYYPSLPIAIATTQKDFGFTSIDQVFNGIGYIGSTVWVEKGVKGLIPNGRNEDGTLRNIEFQTKTVNTITYTTDIKGVHFGVDMYGNPQLNGLYRYDEKDNYVYNGEHKGSTMFCGTYDVVGGKVANFQPKQPFRAVDANTPHIVETYQNGTSWYRVWSDGWCEQGGLVTDIMGNTFHTVTFIKSFVQIPNVTFAPALTNYDGGMDYLGLSFVTNTTAVFTNGHAGVVSMFWRACGYMA